MKHEKNAELQSLARCSRRKRLNGFEWSVRWLASYSRLLQLESLMRKWLIFMALELFQQKHIPQRKNTFATSSHYFSRRSKSASWRLGLCSTFHTFPSYLGVFWIPIRHICRFWGSGVEVCQLSERWDAFSFQRRGVEWIQTEMAFSIGFLLAVNHDVWEPRRGIADEVKSTNSWFDLVANFVS